MDFAHNYPVYVLSNARVALKWWPYMADIMKCYEENMPVDISMVEMFHMVLKREPFQKHKPFSGVRLLFFCRWGCVTSQFHLV